MVYPLFCPLLASQCNECCKSTLTRVVVVKYLCQITIGGMFFVVQSPAACQCSG